MRVTSYKFIIIVTRPKKCSGSPITFNAILISDTLKISMRTGENTTDAIRREHMNLMRAEDGLGGEGEGMQTVPTLASHVGRDSSLRYSYMHQ